MTGERCEICKHYHKLKHNFRTGKGYEISHACTVWTDFGEGDCVQEVVPYDMCEMFSEKGEKE